MTALRDALEAHNAYKSYESEGVLDIYFYRPAGALFALAGKRLGLTPNQLTTASLATGVAGAGLLYWDSWMWTGLGLLVLSGVFDASDGQLARMTQSASLHGRILDGVADYCVFIATYLALAAKYLSLNPDASAVLIFTLAALAGISHSIQASLFDYYRTEYTEYVDQRRIPKSDLESGASEEGGRAARFLAWSHRDYTLRQRRLAASHVRLGEELLARRPDGTLDEKTAAAYRGLNLPVIRWWNLLGANSRLLVIAAALAARRPELYFWAEVSFYNVWTLAARDRQERADDELRHGFKTDSPPSG
ncbi:MAG: CDP-alcohol phosphatidyltransferase family protein [Elusimicrobiota bacterium]